MMNGAVGTQVAAASAAPPGSGIDPKCGPTERHPARKSRTVGASASWESTRSVRVMRPARSSSCRMSSASASEASSIRMRIAFPLRTTGTLQMADWYGAHRHRASALSAFFVEGLTLPKPALIVQCCTLLCTNNAQGTVRSATAYAGLCFAIHRRLCQVPVRVDSCRCGKGTDYICGPHWTIR